MNGFPPDPAAPIPPTTARPSRIEAWARGSTTFVTFLTKAAGVVIASNELLFRDNPHTPALVLSGFMMAGAQVSEGVILGIIDRLMQNNQPKAPK